MGVITRVSKNPIDGGKYGASIAWEGSRIKPSWQQTEKGLNVNARTAGMYLVQKSKSITDG